MQSSDRKASNAYVLSGLVQNIPQNSCSVNAQFVFYMVYTKRIQDSDCSIYMYRYEYGYNFCLCCNF